MDKLVSIIVPVYNVEKFLDKCIESIIKQTYKNIEILCINDGSTDGCKEILDCWGEKDGRIKIIHKENGGLISVRRLGVKTATGEYIAFIDSDDYVKEDMIELLLTSAIKSNSDIAVAGFETVDENGVSLQKIAPKEQTVDSKEALRALLCDDFLETGLYPVWNKLYKTSLFEALSFPSGVFNLGEDQYLNLLLLKKASKVSFLPNSVYSYVQREGSIMHTMKVSYVDSFFRLWELKKKIAWDINIKPNDMQKLINRHIGGIFDLFGFAYAQKNSECISFFKEAIKKSGDLTLKNIASLSFFNKIRAIKFAFRLFASSK